MSRSVGKEFLCKVRYQNPLPSVPFPPKLLPIPPTYVDASVGSYSQARLQHYVQYRHTTLEEATPYPLMVDADYGMPIDPCLLGAFDDNKTIQPQQLDPEDEFLLNLPTSADGKGRGVEAAGNTPGTRTPVTGPSAALGRTPGLIRTGSTAKRTFDHSRAGQLQAIEDSFRFFSKYNDRPDGEQELLKSLKHPTNSKLQAVEAIPLFPDEDLWPNNYGLLSLDVCPDPPYVHENRAALGADEYKRLGEQARQALFFMWQKGKNELGEDDNWCETFLPEDEATAARVRTRLEDSSTLTADDLDLEHRLKSVREYDAQQDPSTQAHYMITLGKDSSNAPIASYVPFHGKVLLKRSNVSRASREYPDKDGFKGVNTICLQLRELTGAESLQRSQKMDQLRGIRNGNTEKREALDSDSDAPEHRNRRAPSYSPSP
ncbi:hypothetical protein LPJ63_000970 [Coemansia sp. RSA 2711]|nr:hypothetical protein LPJ63_000970 [Coemansia sp. RSA 2711]